MPICTSALAKRQTTTTTHVAQPSVPKKVRSQSKYVQELSVPAGTRYLSKSKVSLKPATFEYAFTLKRQEPASSGLKYKSFLRCLLTLTHALTTMADVTRITSPVRITMALLSVSTSTSARLTTADAVHLCSLSASTMRVQHQPAKTSMNARPITETAEILPT